MFVSQILSQTAGFVKATGTDIFANSFHRKSKPTHPSPHSCQCCDGHSCRLQRSSKCGREAILASRRKKIWKALDFATLYEIFCWHWHEVVILWGHRERCYFVDRSRQRIWRNIFEEGIRQIYFFRRLKPVSLMDCVNYTNRLTLDLFRHFYCVRVFETGITLRFAAYTAKGGVRYDKTGSRCVPPAPNARWPNALAE